MASESDDDFHGDVKMVTIRIFSSHETAELAASKLEAHGLSCWLNSDDAGGMYPNLTMALGVRLQVRASDAEAATALLNEQVSPEEINQIETEAATSAQPETVPPKKLAWGQIIFGITIGVLLCLFFQWAGKLGTVTYYHYAKDQPDEAWIYRNGQLIEYRQDRNRDGAWDHRTYYDNGSVTRATYDNNFDGKPDVFYTYSNKTLVSVERDTDFNGTSDMFCTYKDDLLQQVDIKPNGLQYAAVKEIFKNGVLTEILRGGDSSGKFKEDVKYDAFFNPIPIGFNSAGTNIPTTFRLLSHFSK